MGRWVSRTSASNKSAFPGASCPNVPQFASVAEQRLSRPPIGSPAGQMCISLYGLIKIDLLLLSHGKLLMRNDLVNSVGKYPGR
jgi:hypothetical protein